MTLILTLIVLPLKFVMPQPRLIVALYFENKASQYQVRLDFASTRFPFLLGECVSELGLYGPSTQRSYGNGTSV